jgi:hypothetical protein
MRQKLIIVIIGLLTIAAGCPQESEQLLNPPSFSETVNVRLVNLTGDQIEMELSLEGVDESISTGEIPFEGLSENLTPPSDSSLITIRSGNDILFDTSAYYKYSRDFNYIFMALPKANSDSKFDTIIDFTNLGDANLDEVNASVKVFNAIADSNLTIDIQLGCPGGESFNSFSLPYKEYSFTEPMRADDEISLSLVGYKEGEILQLGTFSYEFEQGQEYTLVPFKDQNEYFVYVINENNFELRNLERMIEVEEKFTEIRMINLTDDPISLSRNGEEVISNVTVDYLTEYYNVPACGSVFSETFTLSSNTMNFFYNPDVNLKYTAIAYTSEFTGLDTLIFIEPPIIDVVRDGRALIRAVNVTNPETGLTISFGANSSSQDPENINDRGFTSGSSISRGLLYGEISGELFTPPGSKPIIIFTSNEPSQYISSSVINLEPDANYFIFGNKFSGNYEFFLIEENQAPGILTPLQEGILTGLVNAYSEQEEVSYDLNTSNGNILTDAKVIYEDAVTTVINEGENSISIDGSTENFTVEKGKRQLIISTGLGQKESIFISDDPMQQEDLNFKWRFINAAPNNELISIFLTDGASEEGIPLIQGLRYKDVSLTQTVDEISTYGLIYVDTNTGDTLFNAENLPVTRAKGYSIIFAGSQQNYSVIIQQEF